MTQTDKLKYLVEKAIAGGWEAPAKTFHVSDWTVQGEKLDNPLVKYGIWFDTKTPWGDIYHWQDIIFQHSFCQALFGEEMITEGTPYVGVAGIVHWRTATTRLPTWQYQLQNAVISDDPIDYLYQAVTKGEQ